MNDLICGATGSGKTSYVRGVVDTRINHRVHTMVLTNKVCKRLYWKDHSDLMWPVCEVDLCITENNNTPKSFASYLVKFYVDAMDHAYNMCLIIDDFNFDYVNPDYKFEAYYDAITEECKFNNISTIFTYNCGDCKKEYTFESVPKRLIKASDRITVLK